ncbi:hypothetical protein ACH46_00050 [Gordonia phthalatica]|uniref:Uncharacterized protein n=1 Tax=Gordonia phthalatica TaxID=1136941 RepID=A0A0N9MZJ2_9ACTN|nr:hypothetical protein ACH46_00050 [Gordonia phthalatica]
MFACSGVVIVFGGEATVDVGDPGADAVLVALQGLQVDGVGEVRGEELVALDLEPLAVLSQLGQFLGAGGQAFVERRLDLRGEGGVLGLGDRDVSVAVGDELLGDADRHGPPGAVLTLGGPAGTDVVAVADALLVGWVVQLHP